ncbi:MAG: hypothetical protein ACLGHL_00350 [Actinomycetota bacterium]
MSKRTWALLAAGALLASTMVIGPVSAQEAPAVPAAPNVVDPLNDANYLNDQGLAGAGLTGTPATVPSAGDNGTPADGGSVSDILAVWFTADQGSVYAHIQTQAPGPATAALFYRVTVDPGVGANCLWFQAGAPGAGNAGTVGASLRTVAPCDPVQTVNEGAEFTQVEGPDGTGIHTIKIPRALSAYLVDGAKLATPKAETRHYTAAPTGNSLTAPQIDNTKPGTDYVITSGGEAPPPQEDPGPPSDGEVGEDDPGSGGPKPDQPVKEGCKKKKGKGKKKGCKKVKACPKPASCTPYTPGEEGAEAPLNLVTKDHTAEAPLEITIEQGPGVPDVAASHAFQNLQIDAEGAEGGLFIRYEFPDYEDHDLYVNYADGSEAAHVGGFNPVPVGPLDGTGDGGHSEQGAEQIDGLRTADCAGYTLDLVNFAGEGGEYTVKVWLGEIQNDPAAPGGGR